ncbi:hypothetical protein TNCV_207521 [Trichonephila clavipes]|nr:hypothetical protein TNCV_207521 [Trichonephila clavipes]
MIDPDYTPSCRTRSTLETCGTAVWSAVPQEHIQSLFESMSRRVAAICVPDDPEGQLSTDPGYNCPYKQSNCNPKNYSVHRIPAHIDIFGNDQADNLAKEARNSTNLSNILTLTDADAKARRKLTSHPVKKYLIPELNWHHVISTTISKLRTRHFKEMKISPDGQRSYNSCLHCPDIRHSPNNIFNCPPTLAKLLYIDLNPTDHQLLYSSKVVDIARAISDA